MPITVCLHPPGAPKCNQIEHRRFLISLNGKGKRLVTYETVASLIAGTRTPTGLNVYAKLETRCLPDLHRREESWDPPKYRSRDRSQNARPAEEYWFDALTKL